MAREFEVPIDIPQTTAPANPASGTRRIFTNSATGELSVRTSAGTTVSLETAGSTFDYAQLVAFGG